MLSCRSWGSGGPGSPQIWEKGSRAAATFVAGRLGRNARETVMTSTIELFDTTLRDGAQHEGINYSLADKLNIARKLDEIGMTYIEGGFAGSNVKDMEFFRQAAAMPWQHATIVAFGSSRRKDILAEEDPNLRALTAAQTRAVCIVV